MNSLMQTLNERSDQLIRAIFEHLQISLVSLFIAMVIAIPFAILIAKNKKVSEFTLQVTGILQTIPSMALLGLFIPILGIGKAPSIVALVIYGLFPILQSTLTGLRGIDPLLEEAAESFGMTRREKLKKFEIELAMPSIVGGIRTSSVMLIGTATLAALVGAGGLGSFILLGIDRNDYALILIGAITSALLAVIINAGIKFLEDKKIKTILISFFIGFLILLGSLVSFAKEGKSEIIAAGKLGAEPEILINMYKELIEEDTDLKVIVKPNFGKTSFLYEALKSGSVDLYPEFTGTITASLLENPPEDISNDEQEVYKVARDMIKDQDNLSLLKPMKYQNTYALAVRKEFADKYDLEKISDLKKIEEDIKAGFSLEFNDREDGNRGLKTLYGLNLEVSTMEPALKYTAIANEDVNLIEVYSTDSDIIKYDLVLLEDDKNLFPPYQAAALLRDETLDKYPSLEDSLEKLSGKITSEQMQEMNYRVDVGGEDPASIAHEYLKSEGLIN
ncbi:MAG: ABC transporter permease/substrate-binding protein [Anaerococcus sp.]|nr:ABC transporter permease/substrate-binding protein [Anaerococcus sp.]